MQALIHQLSALADKLSSDLSDLNLAYAIFVSIRLSNFSRLQFIPFNYSIYFSLRIVLAQVYLFDSRSRLSKGAAFHQQF